MKGNMELQLGDDGFLWISVDPLECVRADEKSTVSALIDSGLLPGIFSEELSGKETVDELLGYLVSWKNEINSKLAKVDETRRYIDVAKRLKEEAANG